jgi:DNA (cytosine-5)-methyltransferase 1
MRELALFAGAGGGILGGLLCGWETVCAVEVDTFCAQLLMQRQNEGHLPPFPIWDDVRTFDGSPWNGCVDVISGGFPCQNISSAGNREGLGGAKSGLWHHMARIIGEVCPEFVFIENSPHLRTRGLVTVLQDLDRMGYDTARGVFGADAVGAPHERKRMWIVAHANDSRQRGLPFDAEVASAPKDGRAVRKDADPECFALREQSRRISGTSGKGSTVSRVPDWWPVDLVQGVDDGTTHRMDRVRATGNGQVPAVARLAWQCLR